MTDPGAETDSHDGISIRASRRIARFLFWTTDAFSFDAQYPDGRIETNIDVSEVLETAKYPADAWATRQGAIDHAGEDGEPGQWVAYPSGRPLPDD